MENLVVIGNGMAGVYTIEELLALDDTKYKITIIGEEPYPNYNRIMLSNILQNKTTKEEIITQPYSWYEEHGIRLVNDNPATSINTEEKTVTVASGEKISYDKLLLATGSRAFILPIEGSDLPEIIGFRTIADTERMIELAKTKKKAAVIGGGLLGLEAARGLMDQGMDVTVVHLAEWLMETQLDQKAGLMLQQDLESQGMHIKLQAMTEKIIGGEHVEGLQFADGTTLDADMVVMAVGIRPEITLAQAAGIDTGRGVIVNDYMQTSDGSVFAVGECAEHDGKTFGLVAPLYEQGKVLAKVLAGQSTEPYKTSLTFTQLKVSGCDLYSAGSIQDAPGIQTIEAFDGVHNTYKKIFIQDEHVIGVVLYGDTSEGPRYFSMIRKAQEISELTPISVLHTADGSTKRSVADMDGDEIICGCNGVTKDDIVTAIRTRNLTSLMEVVKVTKAGSSCGKCKGLVNEVLVDTIGADGVAASNGMCSCTELSHEEVREAINKMGLTTSKEVRNVLGFKQEEGCPKCRPALNYYLNVSYPSEHPDERESRYINERLYGNLQKNGNYSVIPRMRAGMTSADQLRKIADAADKYHVPLIKITGSQRIGLFGVDKEDLPDMWEDLDMVAASAYAKAVRSIKTCVGSKYCRFGTQDALGLGKKLEEAYEFIDTPHKFKLGVSACPRSCVESGVKDFGVIGVEGGFQIYIGGNGGTHVVEAKHLVTLESEQEVIDLCGAYLQYYRETANYAERTAPWLERLGLDHVKEVLLDVENQKKLLKKLRDTTDDRRVNPWKEVAENKQEQEEFYNLERV